ncbi:MAG TPA: Rossmann-like and DUF2520 domain-containing protein [Pyrinomonadaceae bacterium]|jgi:predicted short-subunit dehydrogenase-like oxidoreductase (DUF2520 family)
MPTRRETQKRSDQKIETTERKPPRAKARTEARQTPARPTSVAIVGAGRLGSALAVALDHSGYHIAALVARRGQHARPVARNLSTRPHLLDAARLDLLPDNVDLILITTPDDQLAEVAARLAEVANTRRVEETTARRVEETNAARHASSTSRRTPPRRRRASPVALHASGALTSDVLAPLRDEGFSLGSIHPLVSISEPQAGARTLAGGAFYCLEGEARALTAARRIVRALGGRGFSIDARDKSLYHAAAVIASGHTVALFSLASELLSACGLEPARAREVLLPLLTSTLDNLRAHAPAEALTGTFARADLHTVRRHVAALREAGQLGRDALAVYALLGARSLRLADGRGNFDPAVAEEIGALLRRVLERPTKR